MKKQEKERLGGLESKSSSKKEREKEKEKDKEKKKKEKKKKKDEENGDSGNKENTVEKQDSLPDSAPPTPSGVMQMQPIDMSVVQKLVKYILLTLVRLIRRVIAQRKRKERMMTTMQESHGALMYLQKPLSAGQRSVSLINNWRINMAMICIEDQTILLNLEQCPQ